MRWKWIALAGFVAMAGPANAQPMQIPDTWGGDLVSRPRLTGDWGGIRDKLGRRGIVLDVNLLQTFQGVASGGRDTGVEYGGSADYRLHLDTEKLGLWPGGFVSLHAESSFGENVLGDAGALSPVSGDAMFPIPNESVSTLTNLTFMQFLSPRFGIFFGKVETIEGDANAFAGDHRTQFLNLGFNFNMTTLLTPVSALGGGIVLVPWDDATLSLSVLDPSGQPDESGFGDAFTDGVLVAGEGRTAVKLFGLLGHQLIGFTWSNKDRLSLRQDPSNVARLILFQRLPRLQNPGPILRRILERFFPGLLLPVAPLERVSDAWSIYYNFDQYLWSPVGDPTRGVGLFFRIGLSDGKANPIKYHYSVGIGGKGIVPGRPDDTFGVGWSRLIFSDDLFPFLRSSLDLGLDHEDVIELFYNVAVTNWLHVTADLQVIEPGLTKTLNAGNQLKDVDTALVGGLRVRIQF